MSSSLSLTNIKTEICNDMYLIEDNTYTCIRNIFLKKTDANTVGGGNTETLQNNLDILEENFGVFSRAVNEVLDLKATVNNPSFTGNVNINRSSGDTNNNALLIKGLKNGIATNEGIRFGYSTDIIPGQICYGIQICSGREANSTIDFTYPSVDKFYQGRLMFSHRTGDFVFDCRNEATSSNTFDGNHRMYLTHEGHLIVKA